MSIITPQPEPLLEIPPEMLPNYDELVTEDDTPVDNLYSLYQQYLLYGQLREGWSGPADGRPFMVLANVGLFYRLKVSPIVPDVLLAIDVAVPEDPFRKENRSYFSWKYGPPDIAIEIVSNSEGEELGNKLKLYADASVSYYVVWDPERHLSEQRLHIFSLERKKYQEKDSAWFPEANLGLKVWNGAVSDITFDWLRWCDANGEIVPTGGERAEREALRAEKAEDRAGKAEERAAKLAALLKAQGFDVTE